MGDNTFGVPCMPVDMIPRVAKNGRLTSRPHTGSEIAVTGSKAMRKSAYLDEIIVLTGSCKDLRKRCRSNTHAHNGSCERSKGENRVNRFPFFDWAIQNQLGEIHLKMGSLPICIYNYMPFPLLSSC